MIGFLKLKFLIGEKVKADGYVCASDIHGFYKCPLGKYYIFCIGYPTFKPLHDIPRPMMWREIDEESYLKLVRELSWIDGLLPN